jgi:hypothetical protein
VDSLQRMFVCACRERLTERTKVQVREASFGKLYPWCIIQYERRIDKDGVFLRPSPICPAKLD